MPKLAILLLLLYSAASWSQEISYAIVNAGQNVYLKSSKEDHKRPIGSITKLMTALVILKSNLDLNELIPVSGLQNSRTGLQRNMQVSRKNLIRFSIIGSDNLAAETLARSYPGGIIKFVDQMNQTAYDLGMTKTEFMDSTGVGAKNLSTIGDLIILLDYAAKYELIRESSQSIQSNLVVLTGNTIKHLTISTTNHFSTVIGPRVAKTGFTSRAGRCLAMLFYKDNKKYALIVLGAETSTDRDKIVYYLLSKI